MCNGVKLRARAPDLRTRCAQSSFIYIVLFVIASNCQLALIWRINSHNGIMKWVCARVRSHRILNIELFAPRRVFWVGRWMRHYYTLHQYIYSALWRIVHTKFDWPNAIHRKCVDTRRTHTHTHSCAIIDFLLCIHSLSIHNWREDKLEPYIFIRFFKF